MSASRTITKIPDKFEKARIAARLERTKELDAEAAGMKKSYIRKDLQRALDAVLCCPDDFLGREDMKLVISTLTKHTEST